ncbi:MAG: lipocalin family protein [Beijerinckiaceae bacterium]|nr:lipocalin family protein [Beijerinckiaceae bacterium]
MNIVPSARYALRATAAAASLLLAACTGVPMGVEPVRSFDLARYTGKWHAIMRLDHSFERGLTNVTALYTPQGDSVRVDNRGLDRAACRWREISGTARLIGQPDVGSLAVSFYPPLAAGYHVIELDRRGYQWALVSGPTRDYLWILARKPELSAETRRQLVARAASLGYPVERLQMVDHSPPACANGGIPARG